MFPITIRNNATGEEKNFSSLQDVANFLAIAPHAKDWTGYEFAGLPAANAEFVRQNAPADPAPEVAQPEAPQEAEVAVTPEPTPEPSPEVPAEAPHAETLIERIEHAVADAVHSVLPDSTQ